MEKRMKNVYFWLGKINPKYKNIFLWMGIVSVLFASANIDLETLTSWKLLWDALMSIISNPYKLMLVIIGVLGVWNDNGSKGLDTLVNNDRK